MCGRYYVDDETAKEIRKLLEHIDARFYAGRTTSQSMASVYTQATSARQKLLQQMEQTKTDIRPTNHAPILLEKDNRIDVTFAKWGFTNPVGKGVLINARAETAIEKRTFRESLLSRRCIIPATGFYEWDHDKNKFYFTIPNKRCLYMAGLYRYEKEEQRFVIVTTTANDSMKNIHDRMPLILDEDSVGEWIVNKEKSNDILHRTPPELESTAEYVQQKFIF